MASQAPSGASAANRGAAPQRAAFGDDLEFHFPDERGPEDPAELDGDSGSDTGLPALRYAWPTHAGLVLVNPKP